MPAHRPRRSDVHDARETCSPSLERPLAAHPAAYNSDGLFCTGDRGLRLALAAARRGGARHRPGRRPAGRRDQPRRRTPGGAAAPGRRPVEPVRPRGGGRRRRPVRRPAATGRSEPAAAGRPSTGRPDRLLAGRAGGRRRRSDRAILEVRADAARGAGPAARWPAAGPGHDRCGRCPGRRPFAGLGSRRHAQRARAAARGTRKCPVALRGIDSADRVARSPRPDQRHAGGGRLLARPVGARGAVDRHDRRRPRPAHHQLPARGQPDRGAAGHTSGNRGPRGGRAAAC